MARSKASDAEFRSAQSTASRVDESGSQTNRTKGSNARSKGNGFASDDSHSDSPRFGQGESYAKSDTFDREWHDDTGTAEAMPKPDLGPTAALADGIRDAAGSAARVVKEQAAAVASEVGHELNKTAQEQVGRGAEAIRGFASAVEAAGSELEKVSPDLARYVRDSADKIRNVSNDLSNREVNELLKTAADFARSQPAIFIGATIAAGFVLARFLKSSARPPQPEMGMGMESTGFDDRPNGFDDTSISGGDGMTSSQRQTDAFGERFS